MDDADYSSEIEHADVSRAVANHRNRHREQPEYDSDGAKICVDCASLIPADRARIEFTVRCIDCQEEEDRRGRRI